MALEIERKYIVNREILNLPKEGKHIIQGYLFNYKNKSMRIRITDDKSLITIKSGTNPLKRMEFEYEIPLSDAREMLKLCGSQLIDKHRYLIYYQEQTWEIDVFHGENDGLIVAEIELERENQDILLPEWIDKEVSKEERYLNASLAVNPYSKWK